MDTVLKARMTEKGIIVHELKDGMTRQYITIRCGISWPVFGENIPGYYLILGEEYRRHFQGDEQRGKLRLLSEFAAPDIRMSLDTFFSRIVNDAEHYVCKTFYAIRESKGEDCDGYATEFQKFAYKRGISCNIQQPPWADTPGTIVHDQVRGWEPENIKQALLTFPAVNALRFVICGLEANVPTISDPDWRKKLPQGSWRSA